MGHFVDSQDIYLPRRHVEWEVLHGLRDLPQVSDGDLAQPILDGGGGTLSLVQCTYRPSSTLPKSIQPMFRLSELLIKV